MTFTIAVQFPARIFDTWGEGKTYWSQHPQEIGSQARVARESLVTGVSRDDRAQGTAHVGRNIMRGLEHGHL